MFLNPRSTSMRTNKVVPVTTLCFSFVRTSVCLSQGQHSYMFILAFAVVLRHYPTMMPSLCFPPTTVSDHLSLLLRFLPLYSRLTLSRNPATPTHSSSLRCVKACSLTCADCPSWHGTCMLAQYKHNHKQHQNHHFRNLIALVLPGPAPA